MKCTRPDGSTPIASGPAPIYSAFFQQSSFGTFAITNERFAVKVRADAPLDLLGPLACSGQTGAGAVLNVMKPHRGDGIAIFGVGAVGLSALMAAKIAGCDPIPRLVDLIMLGQFPLERMITYYDLADINRAAADSASGRAIKPVLRMPS